ncbi:ribosome recycling factor [Poriferisphaera sp. WC338]|uniref:ribosome recycling factor n=1 Tax=Poriferisphaera sp. WC338 TaxID=3425129 RepID=UPI003D81B70E
MDMDLDTILLETEEAMEKAVDYLKNELRGVRTGRASTALVEYIKVDAYGSMTDLRQLAMITVPEPTQLLIKPFDASILQATIKAIQNAGLGLNPMAEGKQIRLNLPALSGERRQQLIGTVKQMGETSKIAIRNARRDANKHIDKLAKDKTQHIPEDTAASAKDDVQSDTKKYEKQVEEMIDAKAKEIQEI